jgi:hypothetical protein
LPKVSRIGVGETSNSLSARWSLMGGMFVSVSIYKSRVDIRHRTEDFELLASEIQDKTAQNVAAYYPVFRKKWKELSGIGLV